MFLFNPFRGKTETAASIPKRTKTLNALYRILSEEFERCRPCDCSCHMPIVYQCEPAEPGEPNWKAETLWCGCRDCRTALDEVVARNARLFLVKELPAAADQEDSAPVT
ncbi:MAG TPA: hypothetical protein VFP44_19890 [Usitatibacter sp.]|nr:hypothetical protein [Usitatibacter sp.]